MEPTTCNSYRLPHGWTWRSPESPASTLSASLSWGVYLIAAVGLIGAFVPVLNGVYARSDESAAATTVAAVTRVLNGLRPGVLVNLTYSPPAGEPLVLSGHRLALTAQLATVVGACSWNLPNVTLVSGRSYRFYLEGSTVEVSAIG